MAQWGQLRLMKWLRLLPSSLNSIVVMFKYFNDLNWRNASCTSEKKIKTNNKSKFLHLLTLYQTNKKWNKREKTMQVKKCYLPTIILQIKQFHKSFIFFSFLNCIPFNQTKSQIIFFFTSFLRNHSEIIIGKEQN